MISAMKKTKDRKQGMLVTAILDRENQGSLLKEAGIWNKH